MASCPDPEPGLLKGSKKQSLKISLRTNGSKAPRLHAGWAQKVSASMGTVLSITGWTHGPWHRQATLMVDSLRPAGCCVQAAQLSSTEVAEQQGESAGPGVAGAPHPGPATWPRAVGVRVSLSSIVRWGDSTILIGCHQDRGTQVWEKALTVVGHPRWALPVPEGCCPSSRTDSGATLHRAELQPQCSAWCLVCSKCSASDCWDQVWGTTTIGQVAP